MSKMHTMEIPITFRNVKGWRIELGELHMEMRDAMPEQFAEAFSRAWYRIYNLTDYAELEGIGFVFEPAYDGITKCVNAAKKERNTVDALICGVLSVLELEYEKCMGEGHFTA